MHTLVANALSYRRSLSRRWQWVLLLLLAVGGLTALSVGPAGWDWRLSFAWLFPSSEFPGITPLQLDVVTALRLPRFLLAVAVGGILAQCGAVTQALCRNPLADPPLLGVSAGAAVCAMGLIALGPRLGFTPGPWLAVAAFAGALGATFLVYLLSSSEGRVRVLTLLLAGVAVNALATSLIGLFSFYADDSSLRLMNYWSLGSLAGAGWNSLGYGLPFLVLSSVLLFLRRRAINMLLLGEAEARYLGVDVKKLKLEIVVLVALGVAAAVSMTGIIGFVGLVVPHIVRLLVGPDLQRLMPLSIIMGGLVLLLSDGLARVLVAPAELPVGIVTAILGAPFFIYLLRRQRGD